MNRAEIEAAAQRLLAQPGFLLETPLWKLPAVAFGVPGAQVWLKLNSCRWAAASRCAG